MHSRNHTHLNPDKGKKSSQKKKKLIDKIRQRVLVLFFSKYNRI
jgi:hypothetical protein